MSHPTTTRRLRRAGLVVGLVVTLVAGPGVAGAGYAAGTARAGGPCSYGGYTGDASISFDGTPAVGVPVTARLVPGSDWTAGATARVSWSGTGYGDPVVGATLTPRYDVVGADTHATVRVTHGGSSFTAQCDLGAVAWGSIARPAAPQVTGTPLAGHTLHAAARDGDTLPAHARYHFEWFWGTSTSAFATGADLEVTAAMAGRPLVVKAMVSAWGHEESAWSAATTTDPVALESLARPGAPTIDGTPVVDGMLHATTADGDDYPAGATYEFTWFADGTEFATSRDAVLGAGQQGKRITVRVRAIADGYADSPWSALSDPTDPVAAATLTAPSSVAVGGTPTVGNLLTAAVTGSWSTGTQVTYAWKANGTTFGTDPTVTLTNAQLGAMITIELTGTRAGYATRTIVSTPVGPVTGAPVPGQPGKPSISGTPQVGGVLTASPATTDPSWPSGATYRYEWYAGSTLVGTGPQLTVGPDLVDRTITVRTQVSAPGYLDTEWSVPSDPAPPVSPGGLAGPSGVTVSGRVRVGGTLTATSTGDWPAGTTVTYRWLAGGTPFGGSGPTVALGAGQAGARITVEMTGTKPGYEAVTLVSDPTRPVALGTLDTEQPRIHGKAKVGRTLRVTTGTWTPGTRFTYRWFAGGKQIQGADGSSLVITKRLQGKRITVQVVGRLDGYEREALTSDPTDKVTGVRKKHRG